jgi:hypothetical protein
VDDTRETYLGSLYKHLESFSHALQQPWEARGKQCRRGKTSSRCTWPAEQSCPAHLSSKEGFVAVGELSEVVTREDGQCFLDSKIKTFSPISKLSGSTVPDPGGTTTFHLHCDSLRSVIYSSSDRGSVLTLRGRAPGILRGSTGSRHLHVGPSEAHAALSSVSLP